METKNILLRKVLEPRIFRYHLKRFFKITIFASEYIALETKIGENTNVESPRQPVGQYVCLNTKNSNEVTNYIDYVMDQYKKTYYTKGNKHNVSKLSIISFGYTSISKSDYENFIDRLSENNPFIG